jgi:hypothetical protein
VHHLLKVDDYPDEATNLFYLQSVCSECHDQLAGPAYKRKTRGAF